MDSTPTLRVVSLNCGHSWPYLLTALHALEDRLDSIEWVIFALQEIPYGPVGRARSISDPKGIIQYGSLKLQQYQWYYPVSTRGEQPKVAFAVPKYLYVTAYPDVDMGPYGLHIALGSEEAPTHLYTFYFPPGDSHVASWPRNRAFWETFDPPPNSVICGDFNAHSEAWSTGRRRSAARDLLVRTAFFDRWLQRHPQIIVADDPSANTFFSSTTTGTHPDAIFYVGPDLPPLHQTWQSFPPHPRLAGHAVCMVSWREYGPVRRERSIFFPNYLVDPWTEELGAHLDDSFWNTHWTSPQQVSQWVNDLFEASMYAAKAFLRPIKLRTHVWWWSEAVDDILNSGRQDALYQIMKLRRNAYAQSNEEAGISRIWSLSRAGLPRRQTMIPPLSQPFEATRHVEMSQAFFQHYFGPRATAPLPSFPEGPLPFTDLFTELDVFDAIKGMPRRASPGPSGMSVCMLEALVLKHPDSFAQLANACLRWGFYPELLKRSYVSMIPKAKPYDPRTPRAYRPICVEESLAKLLERMFTHYIHRFTFPGSAYPMTQHGGRPGV